MECAAVLGEGWRRSAPDIQDRADGVNVVEDVPLGDGRVCVADAKLFERPVGNVLAAIGAVFNPNWYCSELRSYISGTYCLRLVFAAFFL